MDVSEPDFPTLVGRCIYCAPGAVTSPDELSDEHVIPYSLGGQWKLVEASCALHRKITSAFEGLVSNQGLGSLREKVGVRTRHKKRRTGQRIVSYQVGDQRRDHPIPIADHPAGFAVPVYGRPTRLSGGNPGDAIQLVDWFGRWHVPSGRRLQERFGATAIHSPLVDPIAFGQMLAKSAYAFAVGCVGADAFEEVYVLPTILNAGQGAGYVVGCLDGDRRNEANEGHSITLVTGGIELTAYVCLFAEMGFPEYTVLVGRLRNSTDHQATTGASLSPDETVQRSA